MLQLLKAPISLNNFTAIVNSPKKFLTVLDLKSNIEHHNLIKLSELCPNLTELSLSPTTWQNPADIEIIFKHFINLRKLYIENDNKTKCDVKKLEITVSNLRFLKSFKLFGNFNCISLKDILQLEYIEELNVNGSFSVSS